MREKYLIETAELKDLIDTGNTDYLILDATRYDADPPKAWKEHLEARITANTIFFDLDEVHDKNNPLPHQVPPLEQWVKVMKNW